MAETALLREACEWAVSLKLDDIPADVRDLARAQLLSMGAAAHASMRHPVGERLRRTAFPTAGALWGETGWAAHAARQALLTMALDFDETAFAGHLGHASAIPPMIVGIDTGAGGAGVMVAQVAAAEVAARVTAALTLGSTRGQTATHTHAAAAVVGCGLLLGLGAERLAAALSLALAQPRRVMLPAFMATDAKFWVAAAPILDAARCIQMADRGAVGLEGLMEVPGGVLEELAAVALPEVFSGWGSRWHLRTLSIKAIPGCAYLTSAVEAAASLAPVDGDEVESVEVGASVFTLGMEAESSPYIDGSRSPLPALGFSVGYNLAAALETGSLEVDDLHGERLASPSRWELAGRVRLTHDPDLTLAALAAAAPVGAAIALAGERARAWLQARGTPADVVERVLADAAGDPEFERPAKRIGARVTVRLRDGRVLEARRDAARGCCQEPVAARLALAGAKYVAQAGAGAEARLAAAGSFESMSPTELRGWHLAGAGAAAQLTSGPAPHNSSEAAPRAQ
jgi:2-methylcitrate dehydratase PrpD